MTGRVYLVGAGCGDYDLITLRGKKILSECSCVIYDALIDSRLLGMAAENAELICVGKRSGQHSASQEEINSLLTEKALQGKSVCRLKGGDPFVFGRGGEEIAELKKHGIPYTVVPGISSSIAAAELAGIPVTHRMTSRSFHVITGHTAEGMTDISGYARLEGTLVFLMGLKKLPDIAKILIQNGKSADTPAAVISKAGTHCQRTVRAPLKEIASAAESCEAPAVIVVGETAALDFSPTLELPLTGITVTVTGSESFVKKTAQLLENEGAEAKDQSNIVINPTGEIPELSGYGCIVLTSVNGSRIFLEHLRRNKTDLRSLAGIKFAVVGTGTGAVLEAAGIYPDILPENFTVRDIAETIAAELDTGERILILRADNGSPELTDILSSRGFGICERFIYTVKASSRQLPESIGTDYIIFGSSFGAESFFQHSRLSPACTAVCIGRKTAEAVKKYTDRIIIASPHTCQGAVDSIKKDKAETR